MGSRTKRSPGLCGCRSDNEAVEDVEHSRATPLCGALAEEYVRLKRSSAVAEEDHVAEAHALIGLPRLPAKPKASRSRRKAGEQTRMRPDVLEHVEERPIRRHLLDRRSRGAVLVRACLMERKRGHNQQLSDLGKALFDYVPRTRVGDRYGGPAVLELREARRDGPRASRAFGIPSIRGAHALASTASRKDERQQDERRQQKAPEARSAISRQPNRHSGRVHHFQLPDRTRRSDRFLAQPRMIWACLG
jgi:hypothetical protein